MANPVPIQFSEWRPDVPPHMSSFLSQAVNVLPVGGAYSPFPSHAKIGGTALPDYARGYDSSPLPDGTAIIHAATAQKIYRIGNGITTQVYDAGVISPDNWSFAFFQGRIIAVNPNVPPLGAIPGANFAALGGTPPSAKVCAVVERDFLVLGNLTSDGIDGYQPNRIRWSAFDNPDSWGTDIATQADFQPMPDEGGPVMAITGGQSTGTVFQRKAVTRMQYVGGSTVFDFTTVERDRGAICSGCVVDIGTYVFYIADDGFFAWDGTSSTPIGRDKIDTWFGKRVNRNRLDWIVSGFDPVTGCVLWAFPQTGDLYPSTILCYSVTDQRWTSIDMAVEQLGESRTFGRSLESMPTPDTFGGSFDDPAFMGGKPILAGIDATHTYGEFVGGPLPATIETGDYQSNAGQRSFVNGVRPLTDSALAKVAVGTRAQSDADTVQWGFGTSKGISGVCPQRVDARYLRYRLTMPANDFWTNAIGLEIGLRGSGAR